MSLQAMLQRQVDDGVVPGAIALVARGDDIEVAAAGFRDVDGTQPMTPDTIMRLASITKPVMAALTMMLVDDGTLTLDTVVTHWLPEIGAPKVVRTPASPLDDVVSIRRLITVEDLLTFTAGYGYASDFNLPAVQALASLPGEADEFPKPMGMDAWIRGISRLPMVYQPGDAWLYDTCADILGVLVSRATRQPLDAVFAERIFEPLGMVDAGFLVPASSRDRFGDYVWPDDDGGFAVADRANGLWSTPPTFVSGAGGMVGTVDDWFRFGRMLLDRGMAGGRRVLSAAAVDRMTTNHLSATQAETSRLFLEGEGWGYGGSVDLGRTNPWNVPGRYGWVGGTGTSAHVIPETDTVAILFTQVGMTSPEPPPIMREFWRIAARR